MSQFETDQLQVNRHVRMRSSDGMVKLDTHASRDSIGCWLSGKFGDSGTIGVYAKRDDAPYIMVYPMDGYFADGAQSLPFAISGNGIQVPHPDGRVTMLSLSKIAEIVARMADEQD